ncbi:MAG: hypothetical protein COA62_02895 [Rhodobiaceae bacterium]|nr:MAG: hypothetical protein COA62_02895 [Rhodobiaceae bacterium]
MALQAERRAGTQKRIISVAKKVFARDGYAKASLAEIVDKANVTTGAVYHHFNGKKGLFIAVAEHLEQTILDEVTTATQASKSLWDTFESSILNTLEVCARPDIQQIVFRDAPTIVGIQEWREIEIKYAFGLMRDTIALLAKEEIINAPNPDLLAQVLLGAIMEAAHSVARADDKTLTLKQAKATIRTILGALKSKSK